MPWLYKDVVRHFSDAASILYTSQYVVIHEETEKSDPKAANALLCGDMEEYLEAPFVFLSTNLHLYRMLEVNPNYAERLREVFHGDRIRQSAQSVPCLQRTRA